MAMQNGVPLITTSAGAKVHLSRGSSRRIAAGVQPRGGAQGMKYEETWGGFKIGDSTEVRRSRHASRGIALRQRLAPYGVWRTLVGYPVSTP